MYMSMRLLEMINVDCDVERRDGVLIPAYLV
jgi:hypothetical protein